MFLSPGLLPQTGLLALSLAEEPVAVAATPAGDKVDAFLNPPVESVEGQGLLAAAVIAPQTLAAGVDGLEAVGLGPGKGSHVV